MSKGRLPVSTIDITITIYIYNYNNHHNHIHHNHHHKFNYEQLLVICVFLKTSNVLTSGWRDQLIAIRTSTLSYRSLYAASNLVSPSLASCSVCSHHFHRQPHQHQHQHHVLRNAGRVT